MKFVSQCFQHHLQDYAWLDWYGRGEEVIGDLNIFMMILLKIVTKKF